MTIFAESRCDSDTLSNFILTLPRCKSGHFLALLLLFCCYLKKEKPPTYYHSAVWAAQSCLTLKNILGVTKG